MRSLTFTEGIPGLNASIASESSSLTAVSEMDIDLGLHRFVRPLPLSPLMSDGAGVALGEVGKTRRTRRNWLAPSGPPFPEVPHLR